jgi:hypothetical protein
MRNESLKKTVFILGLLISFFLTSKLDAQIIYTDIPDATPNATYPLDLNNDSIVDFLIQFDLGDKVMCKPQNDNAYSGYYFDNVYLPWANPTNTSICDTLITWYDTMNPGTMASGTNMGYWIGATDKYLALKLIVGKDSYYGWARLDVTASSTSFTIKDYAYQSTPNKCILSGQTSLGLDKKLTNKVISMFPNPCTSTTTIKTTFKFKNTTIRIQNAFGQLIKQLKNISDESFSFSCDNIPKGVYFITVQENNKIIAVEKLVITD